MCLSFIQTISVPLICDEHGSGLQSRPSLARRFWLWERASANKGDLRRLKRPEGSQGWLSWVPFTSKSKSKAY